MEEFAPEEEMIGEGVCVISFDTGGLASAGTDLVFGEESGDIELAFSCSERGEIESEATLKEQGRIGEEGEIEGVGFEAEVLGDKESELPVSLGGGVNVIVKKIPGLLLRRKNGRDAVRGKRRGGIDDVGEAVCGGGCRGLIEEGSRINPEEIGGDREGAEVLFELGIEETRGSRAIEGKTLPSGGEAEVEKGNDGDLGEAGGVEGGDDIGEI